MALPTAPLGQLPSMNMPYAIPTHDRGSSIWEKALAAFLVNAAGGVAQQGVENAMARDFAPEFGEEKAGGLSKLISGPKVGKADATQRRQQAFVRDENEAGRMAAAGQSEADAANALLRLDRQAQSGLDEQTLRDMNADLRTTREVGAADARLGREIESRDALARLQEQLHNERPDVKSQAARDMAAAEEANARTEFQRSIMSQIGGKPTTPTTNSAIPVDQRIAQFAKESTSGLLPSRYESPDERIKRFLDQGVSPDEIVQTMDSSMTPSQAAVQERAGALAVRDERAAQEQAMLIEDIKRRLGLGIPDGGSITSPTGTRIQ